MCVDAAQLSLSPQNSARYGESKDYDPVLFTGAPLVHDAMKERRLSSSRRRDKLKSSMGY